MPIMKRLRENKTILLWFLPFALLFIFMLMWHFLLVPRSGDDAWFRDILSNQANPIQALKEYLFFRYNNWTSRLFSEIFAVTVTHSIFLWKILDAVILTAIPYLMVKLFCTEKNMPVSWAACTCMFLYPLKIFATAGWITTTVFYSWPFFFGLIAMLPFSYAYRGKKLSWLWAFLCVPSLLIACNNEQFCLFLLGITLVLCVLICKDHHKLHGFIILEEVLIVASLVFIFTCPGNWNRMVLEADTWFPEFSELSTLTKFEIGFSSTGYMLMMIQNWLFLLFCVLLLVSLCYRTKKQIAVILTAVLPILLSLILGAFPDFFNHAFPGLTDLRYSFTETGTGFQIGAPASWFPDILFFAVFACVLFCLIVAFKDSRRRTIAISLLLFGLGTSVMAGFSPTVWVSIGRTQCYLYFGLMALIVMLTQQISAVQGKKGNIAFSSVFASCLIIFALQYIVPLFKL